MLKFVDTTASSYGRKRKEPPLRACDKCRRRKKRCKHNDQLEAALTEAGANGSASNVPPTSALFAEGKIHEPIEPDRTAGHSNSMKQGGMSSQAVIIEQARIEPRTSARAASTTSRDARAADSRFVGDMNPEGVFQSTADLDSPALEDSSGVGKWLAQRVDHGQQQSQPARRIPSSSIFGAFPRSFQQIFLPILEKECLSTLPPQQECEPLLSAYFKHFQPLWPVIDETAYKSLPTGDPRRILLEQGMMLAGSVEPALHSSLRFQDSGDIVDCRTFGHRLMGAMRTIIDIGLVTERMVIIQAVALMAFYSQGRDDSELPSILSSIASHDVFSMGLHIPSHENCADFDYPETIFCCVWALDRIQAAIQGRPVLMHQRDIARDLSRAFRAQAPAFRLLLHVVDHLDRVITIYRPGNSQQNIQGDFHLFEDLVIECEASALGPDVLATIETLFHAVSILSCRVGEHTSSPAATTRQLYSTERITDMISKDQYTELALFPFVPYAVSLAASVNYRGMRRSQIPMLRSRARKAFEANCDVLAQLGDVFKTASSMAEKGLMMLREIDRIYLQVVDESRRKSRGVSAANADGTNVAEPGISAADGPEFISPTDPNSFYFTDLPQLDPFELFDPEFCLDDIDAFMEGALDIGGGADAFH